MTWSDSDFQAGLEYQDFITRNLYFRGIILIGLVGRRDQKVIGENLLGLEIKLDRYLSEKGTLFIETEQRDTAGEWKPSGAFANDKAWLFGIGDYSEFFIFSKKFLQRVALSSLKQLEKWGICKKSVKSGDAAGIVIPRGFAEKHADLWMMFPSTAAKAAKSL